jgi:hypothetical protein
MNDTLTVYLDHLIPRENLRYRRPQQNFPDKTQSKQVALSVVTPKDWTEG